jgi:hypothetical protein
MRSWGAANNGHNIEISQPQVNESRCRLVEVVVTTAGNAEMMVSCEEFVTAFMSPVWSFVLGIVAFMS